LHHEIQAVHRELIAVTLAEILYFDHCVCLSGNGWVTCPAFGGAVAAIGIRASAVVMMVEPHELFVLTAVAGHRLPNCWRDNDKCRGMAGSRFRLFRE
jgi:hypothetical protein